MIKATELRIGNYIDINGSIVPIGYGVIMDAYQKNKGIKNNYLNSLDFNPILLTSDILEKCGFKKSQLTKKVDLYYLEKGGFNLVDVKDGWQLDSHCFIILLKYLHQLQNLYYCLTEKELEVKL